MMSVLQGLFVLFGMVSLSSCQSKYGILITLPPPVNLTNANIILTYFLNAKTYENTLQCNAHKHFQLYTLSNVNWTSPLQDFLEAQRQFIEKKTILTIGAPTLVGDILKSDILTTSSDIKMQNYPDTNPYFASYFTSDAIGVSLANMMLKKIQENRTDASKETTLFILSKSMESSIARWKNTNIVPKLVDSILGLLRFYFYTNDYVLPMNLIREHSIVNIVVILPGRHLEKIIEAAGERNLLNWKYRWILINLNGRTDLLQSPKHDWKTANITSFEYDGSNVAGIKLYTSDDILMYDMINATMTYDHYIFCNGSYGQALNAKMDGLAGEVVIEHLVSPFFSTIISTRGTYKIKVSNNLGHTKTKVGNVVLKENGDILLWDVPSPTLKKINRTLYLEELRHYKMHLLTIIEPPFITYKTNSHRYPNMNDKLEGFSFELVDTMLRNLNLSYQYHMYTGPDSFGGPLPNGEWSGMLGELYKGYTDMVVYDYTLTKERAEGFDFVKNILTFTHSVLLSPLDYDLYALFDFLYPLTWEVWVVTISCTIGVAIVLAIMHFISPNDNVHLHINFNFYESIFFTIGTFFNGVSITPPNRSSGRLVACMWWLFALVTVVVYISNYGAMRTKTVMVEDIKSTKDILHQTKYQYGVVKDSSFYHYFKHSTTELIHKMFVMMNVHFSDGLMNSTSHAVDRVRAGDFGLITASYVADYYAYTECLRTKTNFDFFELGYPLQKDSIYFDILNEQMDALRKSGYIDKLKLKYWPPGISYKCQRKDVFAVTETFLTDNIKIRLLYDSYALTLRQMMGIFMILITGCVISVIFALAEYAFRRTRQKYNERARRNRNRMYGPDEVVM